MHAGVFNVRATASCFPARKRGGSVKTSPAIPLALVAESRRFVCYGTHVFISLPVKRTSRPNAIGVVEAKLNARVCTHTFLQRYPLDLRYAVLESCLSECGVLSEHP